MYKIAKRGIYRFEDVLAVADILHRAITRRDQVVVYVLDGQGEEKVFVLFYP